MESEKSDNQKNQTTVKLDAFRGLAIEYFCSKIASNYINSLDSNTKHNVYFLLYKLFKGSN